MASYTPVDLAVTTDDYDRASTAVGTLSTDANLEQQTFTFDVTCLAVAAAGGRLGFRVQLAVDPEHFDFRPLGSAFRVTLGIVTPPPLAIGFEFSPDPLNLSSRGRWVTGYLEPPHPIAAGNIDVASIRLNGIVVADPAAPSALGDHDGDGVTDLTMKFDRAAVELTVAEGDNVAVVVTGTVDGEPFTGTDNIHVRRDPGPGLALVIRGPAPNATLDGRLWVVFTLRDGSPARLELLDVAGRALISTRLGALGPGRHACDLSNGRALAPGIYFLRLMQNGHEVRARAAVLR